MMAKPMKTLELHYPMIQFLIIAIIYRKEAKMHDNMIVSTSSFLGPVPELSALSAGGVPC